MKTESKWWRGFLKAEEEVKSGVTRITTEIDSVQFHYPEGGTSGYCGGDWEYLRGMKDYVRQYEQVIKEILE